MPSKCKPYNKRFTTVISSGATVPVERRVFIPVGAKGLPRDVVAASDRLYKQMSDGSLRRITSEQIREESTEMVRLRRPKKDA
jgi:hypothetical protein